MCNHISSRRSPYAANIGCAALSYSIETSEDCIYRGDEVDCSRLQYECRIAILLPDEQYVS
jgi:hypothetical protein